MNTALAENYIEKSGKTKVFLAKKLGVTPQTFFNKLHGYSDFTVKEADIFCHEVGISSNKVIAEIFLS